MKGSLTKDNYRLLHSIGSGWCGIVRKGTRINDGEVVAVKTIRREQCEEEGVSFPTAELELMRILNHPNVCKLIDASESEDQTVLYLHYYSKGDLFSYLQSCDPLCENQALSYARDIVQALVYLHSQSIWHRDVKEENCFLTKDGNLVLGDFGFAVQTKENLTDRCGSLETAAPELFDVSEPPYAGGPVDIWAVGVIIYDMVLGDLPFETKDALMSNTWNCPDEDECSISLIRLLLVIFQDDPSSRPSAPKLLEHSWFKDKNMAIN